MEETGFGILATSRAESTAATLGLAILSSCFLLMVYRPRRTELEGTPHRVPLIALFLAVGWVMLAAGAHFLVDPSQPPRTLSVSDIWMDCAQSVVVLVILASAYLIPRSIGSIQSTLTPVPSEDAVEDVTAPEPVPQSKFLPEDWGHHLSVGLTVGLAAMLPTLLLGYWIARDRDPSESHILLRTLQGKGWDFLAPIVLTAAVLAPLLEELLFRVILQGWLSDSVQKSAIPLTAGIFALIHGASDAALLVPLALSLGFLYEYRRSYLEVVAAHAAFNGANLFAAINAV
ncbi:CAAX amino terminal protease self- immunity [Caulifigura coniformis]|uniref:CAAX amino terminal protease self-immunity n=1 Tax=Caulifigura coniformis TaxID=2527983 RepID=A0A517S8Z0_9PLAN|nr:CPBP family intramembrane glutamic endopeptidase [Caulifigura coniformis]QDT52588.1 CAAX amino terminal protease self- immunity [Caulifigura coniformis]